MGCYCRKHYYFMAPSCKLELARFSAWLKIHDGADCGKSFEYQPAIPHPLQKPEWLLGGPQWPMGVWKGVDPLVSWVLPSSFAE